MVKALLHHTQTQQLLKQTRHFPNKKLFLPNIKHIHQYALSIKIRNHCCCCSSAIGISCTTRLGLLGPRSRSRQWQWSAVGWMGQCF